MDTAAMKSRAFGDKDAGGFRGQKVRRRRLDDWLGNVRELRNAIERGIILEESAFITSSSLPLAISRLDGRAQSGAPTMEIRAEWTSLEDNERHLVARAGADPRQRDRFGFGKEIAQSCCAHINT